MRILRPFSAGCLSLCPVCDDIGIHISNSSFLKMATSSPLSESCVDWKHIKCSRDELRLDVTLASGQSFRLESCCP